MTFPTQSQVCPHPPPTALQSMRWRCGKGIYSPLPTQWGYPFSVRQSQRDCVLQPRVARNELPWVGGRKPLNPERVPSHLGQRRPFSRKPLNSMAAPGRRALQPNCSSDGYIQNDGFYFLSVKLAITLSLPGGPTELKSYEVGL